MYRLGCFTLALALFLAFLLPLLFFEVLSSALAKLGLPPDMALIFLLGMLAGSLVNIPIRTLPASRFVRTDPLAILGLTGLLPHIEERSRTTTIAMNVGGCLIPTGLALYQVVRLARGEGSVGAIIPLLLATMLNVLVCWRLARPVSGIGIFLPGLVPPLVAAASALLLAPEHAPQVAYVAGVAGPLIGGDLLHLREITANPVGLASIGGAGTFDGIVLSGVLAAFLA